MINEKTTCSQSKCTARMKYKRYKDYLRGTKTNPIIFSGNKRQACTNYIALK
jgi:hypothetical protein